MQDTSQTCIACDECLFTLYRCDQALEMKNRRFSRSLRSVRAPKNCIIKIHISVASHLSPGSILPGVFTSNCWNK